MEVITSTENVGEEDQTKRCISCGSEQIRQIVRDTNFNRVIRFYWESMGMEVKPMEYGTHSLCKPCFRKLVDLYDTHQMVCLFENKFTNLHKSFIEKTVDKLKQAKAKGQGQSGRAQLGKLQEAVLEKWGNGCKLPVPDISITGTLEVSDALASPPAPAGKKNTGNAKTKPGRQSLANKKKTPAPPPPKRTKSTPTRRAASKAKEKWADATSSEDEDANKLFTPEDSESSASESDSDPDFRD